MGDRVPARYELVLELPGDAFVNDGLDIPLTEYTENALVGAIRDFGNFVSLARIFE